MNGKKHKFWPQKNKKKSLLQKQEIFDIDDIYVNKILVSKEEPYGTNNALKYFIGYNDNDVIRPSCLKLSKMTGYTRKFKENITMSLRVNDKQLFKNCNKIWKKFYPQTFLEECKYVQEKIKLQNYINDSLDSESDDETKSDNNNDNDKYDE